MEKSQISSEFTKNFFSQFATPKEELVCVTLDASLTDAAKLMRDNHVGSVIVVTENSTKKVAVGMLTDRDIALETIAQAVDPNVLKVRDIMSRSLAQASENDDIFTMIAKMKENGINRLPVISESGELIGIVTSKKLTQCLIEGLHDLSSLSKEQHHKEEELRH